MIISASRRTDIPAFYAEWMVRRLKEGYCTVVNPFNRNQVTRISLKPEDVDAIVFWTRNPRPLMAYLDELDSRGYRYYFQFTILGYPRELDPRCPPATTAAETFRDLAERLGSETSHLALRPDHLHGDYAPGVSRGELSAACRIAQGTYAQGGHQHRGHVSENRSPAEEIGRDGGGSAPLRCRGFRCIDAQVGETGGGERMEIVSFAEEIDLRPFGILPGKCVDDQVIAEAFGIEVPKTKDPTQRAACGCVVSRDIGMYESCLFGCQYCYATKSFDQATVNFESHDPNSPSLLGWHEPPERVPGWPPPALGRLQELHHPDSESARVCCNPENRKIIWEKPAGWFRGWVPLLAYTVGVLLWMSLF